MQGMVWYGTRRFLGMHGTSVGNAAAIEGRRFLKACGIKGVSKIVALSIGNSRAHSTWKAYRSWVEQWRDWIAKKKLHSQLISDLHVASFLVAVHSQKSVSQASAALRLMFSLQNKNPNPIASQVVSLVKANARRSSAATRHKKAFTRGQIQKLLVFLFRKPTVLCLRLAAMVILCFLGCLRVRECINLNLTDIHLFKDRVELLIRGAKTDRNRDGQHTVIKSTGNTFCVANLLRKYLKAAQLNLGEKGAVFRAGYYNKQTQTSSLRHNTRIGYNIAQQQLNETLRACSIQGNYSWHSLRSGGTSEALRRGAPSALVQAHGRWATVQGMAPYIERSLHEKKLVSSFIVL